MPQSASLRRVVRLATGLGWLAVAAAPFATHVALATGRFGKEAAGLAAVEYALLGTVAARRMHGWRRGAAIAVVMALLTSLLFRTVVSQAGGAVSLIAAAAVSHAFIYGSLLILFGASLRAGRTDLITGLASRLRGGLTPEMRRYTRGVTQAWCIFFAGQLVLSALLLLSAPHRVWSLFVNILDAPSVVLMFAAEYAWRRWRFRDYHHISPIETFRSFARDRAARS